MFIAGVTSVTLNIPIKNDNIREEPEKFNLVIDESSLPSGVTSSDSMTTITILDNDCKLSKLIFHVVKYPL